MSNKRFKHVSFDLDGTLIDSIPAMRFAWELAMQEIGLEVPFVKYRKYVGLPFNIILKHLGLDDFSKEIASIYFPKSLESFNKIRLMNGSLDIIDYLQVCGITTSIITSKPRQNAEYFCKKLNLNTNELICGDDTVEGKPYVEPGKMLLAKLCLDSEEVMYVGDMIFDFQFAINCGFDFVHFNNYGNSQMPNNLLNNIKSIENMNELKEYL